MRDRLCWDDYFMVQALWAPMRSPDESTRHGSFIVSKDNVPIAQGYNGFPRGCNDELMPQTRPEKYDVIIHSELNAIFNANSSVEGATLYVSGPPCVRCWCAIIQVGIIRVIYGPVRSNAMNSVHTCDVDYPLTKLLLDKQGIEVVEWRPKNSDLIIDGLDKIRGHIEYLEGVQ